jgi:subtilisin-like proprotein convertase family protein
MKKFLLALATASVLAGCGDAAPQYGELVITQESPRATLTGRSGGARPAIELGSGCTGFVHADAPDHVFDLRDPMKIDIIVRSTRGPLALAIVGEDATLCDADEGTGHEPRVQIVTPGRYEVYVASLSSQDGLAYDLSVGPEEKDEEQPGQGGGGGTTNDLPLQVSVTSTPAGAIVRTSGGQVLGTTPAMFVWPVARAEAARPQSFVVEIAGSAPTTVTGIPTNGELTLHATLSTAPVGPAVAATTTVVRSTGAAVPIRDFASVTLTADVPNDCTLASVGVETGLRHSYISDLIVTVTPPGGSALTLHNHRGAGRRNLNRTFRSTDRSSPLRALVNTNARGTWTLTVRDTVEADTGTLESFALHLGCTQGGTAVAPSAPSGAATRTATARTGTLTGLTPTLGLRNPFASPRPSPTAATGNEVLNPWGN